MSPQSHQYPLGSCHSHKPTNHVTVALFPTLKVCRNLAPRTDRDDLPPRPVGPPYADDDRAPADRPGHSLPHLMRRLYDGLRSMGRDRDLAMLFEALSRLCRR